MMIDLFRISYPKPHDTYAWVQCFVPHHFQVISSHKLSGELWYLQHSCVRDDIVYHYDSFYAFCFPFPDSKIHGAHWVLSAPDGPHVGPKNLAIMLNVFQKHRNILASSIIFQHRDDEGSWNQYP